MGYSGGESDLLEVGAMAIPAGHGLIRDTASTVTELNTYPLRLSTFTKIFFPVMLAIMLIGGGSTLVAAAISGEPEALVFGVIWFGVLGYFGFQAFSLPQSIVLREDDLLEFRAPIRTRTIPIADLESIEPVPNQFGFFKIKSSRTSVTVLMQFDGFHELVATLKAKNPKLSLLGC